MFKMIQLACTYGAAAAADGPPVVVKLHIINEVLVRSNYKFYIVKIPNENPVTTLHAKDTYYVFGQ
jgi:hypothetical protein